MTLQRFSSNKNSSKYDFKQSFKALVLPSISLALVMIFNIYLVYEYFISQGLDGINAKGVNFFGAIIGKGYTTFRFMDSSFVVIMIYALAFCGFLFALFSFLPFMKKKCVNFYHSSPVTRNDLFKNRIASSVILMVGILFVGVAIVTSFNLIVIDDKAFIIKFALAYYFECFVYLLVFFSIFVFALSVANTFVEGIILGGGLVGLPSIVALGLDNFYQVFLKGYSRDSVFGIMLKGYAYDVSFADISLLHKSSIFNPLLFGADMKTHHIRESILASSNFEVLFDEKLDTTRYEFFLPTPSQYIPIIIWAVVSVAILFLAGYAFKKRKVENAGIHASNKHINLFVALEFAFVFSSMLVTVTQGNKILSVILAIISYVLSFVIFYSVSIRKIKHSKKALVFTAVSTVCFSLFIAIISLGGLGYSNYVPKADKVEMVTVAGADLALDGALYTHINNEGMICPTYRENAGMGVFTEKDSIDKFIDIANHFNDKTDDMSVVRVNVVYQLKNGKKVYRTYEELDSSVKTSLLQLSDTKEYKENLYWLLTGEGNNKYIENISKYGFNNDDFLSVMNQSTYDFNTVRNNIMQSKAFLTKTGSKSIEIKNTPELLKAIAKDYVNTSYEEIYLSNEMPVYNIGFDCEVIENYDVYYDGKSVEALAETDGYMSVNSYYIYPSMKNTINYLNSVGALDKIEEYGAFKSIDCIYVDTVSNISKREELYYDNGMFVGGFYWYKGMGYDDNILDRMIDSENNSQNKITDKSEIDKYLSKATSFKYANPNDVEIFVQGTDAQGNTIYLPLIMTNN